MTVQWFNASLGAPVVSIGPNGLTFSAAARTLVGNPPFVKIGVDPEFKRVLVAPALEADDFVVKFEARASQNGYVRLTERDIPRFIKSQIPEFDLDHTYRYVGVWNDAQKALQIDLKGQSNVRKKSVDRKREAQ